MVHEGLVMEVMVGIRSLSSGPHRRYLPDGM